LVLVLLVVGLTAAGLAAGRVALAASAAPVQAQQGMVVTSQPDATRAGVAVLEAGGNAVDAAAAAAFALGVTQPFSAGIGGGGFMLIRLADGGEVIAIDAREMAPAAASRDMYVKEGVDEHASLLGGLAVGTPGLVAGLDLAVRRYGTMPLGELLQPAIALTEAGFAIGPHHARMIERMRRRLPVADAFAETARIQFPPRGHPAEPGWLLMQPELGATLTAIAEHGPGAFYRGPVAAAMAAEVVRRGGILTEADLAGYQPRLREAVSGSYRGVEVHSFPPPSSGGVVLLEILNILEGFDLASRGAGSSAGLHVIAEAMKLAFADRAAYLGDADFVEVPVDRLIAKRYAERQRARINPPWFRRAPWKWLRREQAIRVEGPGLEQNDSGTTHLSVTDGFGNAVALTMTINTPYGSGITVPGTGILLNNEMDDFAKAPGEPNVYGLVDTRGMNAIEPGKRPLSSMTPTILVKDGRVLMVTGSPGGPRIISSVLLTILNVLDYRMDVQEAVSVPRFHHQWLPDRLLVEPATPEDVVSGLRARGHQVEISKRNWSAAQAIVIDPGTGRHSGGSDPRSDGLALGY
jgi:gamma-glutamyltranspeptidase/glutathione hydrolase